MERPAGSAVLKFIRTYVVVVVAVVLVVGVVLVVSVVDVVGVVVVVNAVVVVGLQCLGVCLFGSLRSLKNKNN